MFFFSFSKAKKKLRRKQEKVVYSPFCAFLSASVTRNATPCPHTDHWLGLTACQTAQIDDPLAGRELHRIRGTMKQWVENDVLLLRMMDDVLPASQFTAVQQEEN